ncbi:peptidase C39 [Ectothiorhodospira haloalkaliphila]|uniref:Peptidase C39 n=1 Tax=Ectothiorhodospira haloalkaliphila TaxID=421628 RepID=W8KKG9_9GAMM|nr:C39 family peptidase [Ectothiorhodospira haloalkaliphila]AHK80289.1 peptidase C39 [Ectothiorhodospira haloalkaliphila]
MSSRGSSIIGVVALVWGGWALMAPSHGHATGMVHVPGAMGSHEMTVTSLQGMRFKTVVRQQYDFSCGSAALATLLTYHYDRPTQERDTFEAMYEMGDQARIREQGFSMLDMKRYLAGLGIASDGFRLPLETLEEVGVPAIALVDIEGYRHFVVVKGIKGDRVLVGDPALGVTDYSRAEFEAIRSNDILFLIRDQLDLGRANFNAPVAWESLAAPPYGTALARNGLADFILALPRHSDW